MTHAVVMKMVEGLDLGHHIYVDNFYTSPQLFHDLRAVGLGACGTVRLNRRGLPKSLNTPVGKGEIKVVRVDESMLAVNGLTNELSPYLPPFTMVVASLYRGQREPRMDKSPFKSQKL